MEGVYSELHSVVAEVGVPVSVSHFDLHEEMLWVGSQVRTTFERAERRFWGSLPGFRPRTTGFAGSQN